MTTKDVGPCICGDRKCMMIDDTKSFMDNKLSFKVLYLGGKAVGMDWAYESVSRGCQNPDYMKLCQSEFSNIVKKPKERIDLNMRINENQILFKEERTKKSRRGSLKMFFVNIDKVAATIWRDNALGIVVFDIAAKCFICHVVFGKKLGDRIGHAFNVAFKLNQEKIAKAKLLMDLPDVPIETPVPEMEPVPSYSYQSPIKIETPPVPEPVALPRSPEKPLPTPEPVRFGTPLAVKIEREAQKDFQVGLLGIVGYIMESGILSPYTDSSKPSEMNIQMEHRIANDNEFKDLSSNDLSVALKPWSPKNRDKTINQVKVNLIKNLRSENQNNVYIVIDLPGENIGNMLKGKTPIDLVLDSMTCRINLQEN
ncbi:unnamed protein product [Gordionus sp. m RMFG-2023]